MPDSVVPDPEFEPAVDLDARRAGRIADAVCGVAEREAASLIASSRLNTTSEVHAVLTLAFLKGYLHGAGVVIERLDTIIEHRTKQVES